MKRTLAVFLVVAMTFVSGYLSGRAEPAGGPLSFLDVLQPATARASQVGVPSSDEQLRFKALSEAWQIVERDFYDQARVDQQKLLHGAIKGMVDAVGDPYTVYQTPSQRELNDTDLRGSFDGIGIQTDMKENRLTVVAPIEGSPAEAAGFRPGDVVLEVDGTRLDSRERALGGGGCLTSNVTVARSRMASGGWEGERPHEFSREARVVEPGRSALR